MQSSSNKLYEVERIAGRRHSQGKDEYYVFWKGYDNLSATWEPIENLTFCKEVVKKFVSKISPIPGGIPCNISELISKNKAKTVSVKMLLTRKLTRARSKSASGLKSTANPLQFKKSKKSFTETEKLIRDTLLHESKTMYPTLNIKFLGTEKEETSKTHRLTLNDVVKSLDVNSRKRKVESVSSVESFNQLREGRYGDANGNLHTSTNLAGKQTLRDAGEGDHVICQKHNNYMKITLNNTARHNILTTHMMDTITQCLLSANKDSSIRAVVLRNNGDHFCSGIDFSELIECDDKQYKPKVLEICESIRSLTESLIHFPKPILVAVNGFCLGFGVSLVSFSDLTFTSSKTSFGLTSCKLDLTPTGCLTYLLPKLVGPAMANSMLFLGKNFRATAAYDRGLINDIYGIHSFHEDVEMRINELISGETQVMEGTKRMLRELDLEKLEKTCDSEMKAFAKCLSSDKCRRRLRQDWTVTINLYGSGQ